MFSPKSTDNLLLTDKLKEGLMRSPNLIAFCENYREYASNSKNFNDKFLISLCKTHLHLDISNIPSLTDAEYKKHITHLIKVINQDKLLLARLQSLCKAEIEEEFHYYEDILQKEHIKKHIGILIDFHHKLCEAINTPQSKADAKIIHDTVSIWMTENKHIQEEVKEINTKKQKHPKMHALKSITHVLGVSGIFKASNDSQFVLGGGYTPDFIRDDFCKFLTHFTKQNRYRLLEEKEKTKLKLFIEALNISKNITPKEIISLLKKNKSLQLPSGWMNKEISHCVGFYAFVDDDSLKLISCNRGSGIEFVKDKKGNPYFCGNIIFSIPNNDLGKEAISKLFANDSPFNRINFEKPETFYKEFDRFLEHYHFTAIEYQPLRPLKRANCTMGNQKSLLHGILSNTSYKIVTEEWRKEAIISLLQDIKKHASTKESLKSCFQLQILYNYLIKTESAFARNKVSKQKLLSMVYAELSKIYKATNPTESNHAILKDVLKRFENDKKLGQERYQYLEDFKKQEELHIQWYDLQSECKKTKKTIPMVLNNAYHAFLTSLTIETAKLFKETLMKVKTSTQDVSLLKLLSAILNTIDKMDFSSSDKMDISILETTSNNDYEFNEEKSRRIF